MAISLMIQNPYTAENATGYGRITRIENLDLVRNVACVEVSWYASAQARQAGGMPLRKDRVAIGGSELTTLLATIATPFDAVRTALYEHVTETKYPDASQV